MTTARPSVVVSADERPSPVQEPVAIRLVDVVAGYGDTVALDHLTIDVPRGSLLAVVGPNGAGKSTMLKVIAGLMPVASGQVEVLGGAPRVEARADRLRAPGRARRLGLPGHGRGRRDDGPLSAAIGIGRRPGRADRERVDAALETVSMTACAAARSGDSRVASAGGSSWLVPWPPTRTSICSMSR